MQLRQNRKKKSIGDDDLGYEEKPPKQHKKTKNKLSNDKDHSNDEVRIIYINNLNNFLKYSLQIYQKNIKKISTHYEHK